MVVILYVPVLRAGGVSYATPAFAVAVTLVVIVVIVVGVADVVRRTGVSAEPRLTRTPLQPGSLPVTTLVVCHGPLLLVQPTRTLLVFDNEFHTAQLLKPHNKFRARQFTHKTGHRRLLSMRNHTAIVFSIRFLAAHATNTSERRSQVQALQSDTHTHAHTRTEYCEKPMVAETSSHSEGERERESLHAQYHKTASNSTGRRVCCQSGSQTESASLHPVVWAGKPSSQGL